MSLASQRADLPALRAACAGDREVFALRSLSCLTDLHSAVLMLTPSKAKGTDWILISEDPGRSGAPHMTVEYSALSTVKALLLSSAYIVLSLALALSTLLTGEMR